MNIALLIAGGSGNRMGQDIPKQFMHVDGLYFFQGSLDQRQRGTKLMRDIGKKDQLIFCQLFF